jgi:hypothetical protein
VFIGHHDEERRVDGETMTKPWIYKAFVQKDQVQPTTRVLASVKTGADRAKSTDIDDPTTCPG